MIDWPWPDCENCGTECIPSDDGLCYSCAVLELVNRFADYLTRARAGADEEPLTTALLQFGRDQGPSRRAWAEREVADRLLAFVTRRTPSREEPA